MQGQAIDRFAEKSMLPICRHLLIDGRVQGVGFRWSLRAQAQALGLTGWVRNRRDGRVEAMICGAPEAVEALTAWAYRGPPGARVEHVLSNDVPGEDETLSGFAQRPTY
jgi:acylphosphatase